MSAEKSPIKRESIELSLCYYEMNLFGATPCPRRKERRVRVGVDRHAGACKAIQVQGGGI